jgi:hypothetical protein
LTYTLAIGISAVLGTILPLLIPGGFGLNYGNWLNGNTLNAENFPKIGVQIPSVVFSTIMFYNSVVTLSKMAASIEMKDKARYYTKLADRPE